MDNNQTQEEQKKTSGELFIGRIKYSELVRAAQAGHSAFKRSPKDEEIYVDVAIWKNTEDDKYGNQISIKLNNKIDSGEGNLYIGNAWVSTGGRRLRPGECADNADVNF